MRNNNLYDADRLTIKDIIASLLIVNDQKGNKYFKKNQYGTSLHYLTTLGIMISKNQLDNFVFKVRKKNTPTIMYALGVEELYNNRQSPLFPPNYFITKNEEEKKTTKFKDKMEAILHYNENNAKNIKYKQNFEGAL